MLLSLLTSLALANGQTSHQRITLDATALVPPGDLADFVARDDVRGALLNGTMFPDGGYAVGHGYGEASHWEPMQDLYLDWIRVRCQVPYEGDCAQHVAFLLGMRSHGIADQLYDAVYMERSKQVDAELGWATGESMDEATDVAFVAATAPGFVPEPFVPYQPLLELLGRAGEPVDVDTLDDAQNLLGLAIWYVGAAGTNPDAVMRYTEQFPWACTHQVDAEVAGNPTDEADTVGRYWQVTWARLQGADGWSPAVMDTYPGGSSGADALDMAYGYPAEGHVREAADVRSRLQVMFARGLDPASVTAERFRVEDAAGIEVPVTVNLFYGRASHVVNLAPLTDWGTDEVYTVTVGPGITTFDGIVMDAPYTFRFTTAPAPAEDGPQNGLATAADQAGCGCTGVGGGEAGTLALLAGTLLAARLRRVNGA